MGSEARALYFTLLKWILFFRLVIFGWLWNKKSEKLFNFYPVFCVLETTLGIMTTAYAITTHNIMAYYLLDTFVFAIVTRNICCGGVKLREIR